MSKICAIDIVIDILKELGYKDSGCWGHTAPTQQSLDYGEYEWIPPYVRFRVPYGRTGHKKYGSLKIQGQKIHIHGHKIDCIFIDLADPRSLDQLRNFITNAEEMDESTSIQKNNSSSCD